MLTTDRVAILIQEGEGLTVAHLAAAIGVNKRTIERNLKRLQEKGRIRRVGPAKGGHWEIVNVKTET